MTVSTTINRTTQNGNGTTTTIPINFGFQKTTDLVVLLVVISTDVATTQVIGTHYTIGGTPDALGHYSGGGSVEMVIAPSTLQRVVVYRDAPRTQSLDLVENDNLPAASTEAAIDYQTMLIQRVADLIARSLRQPDGDSANIAVLPTKVGRLGKYLGFDLTTGDPVPLAAPAGTTAVSSFMATVLDDTTAEAAMVTLTDAGDWTPSVGGTATYTTQVGKYYKHGKEVTVYCNLVINVIGTGSPNTISGLPFVVSNAVSTGAVSAVRFVSLSQNVVYLIASLPGAGSAVLLMSLLAAGASLGSNNVMGNATAITFTAKYITV